MLEDENNQQLDPKYSLHIDCASALNFVLKQNSVPLIRQILMSSTEIISDSRLVIRSNPEFFKGTHESYCKSGGSSVFGYR